MSLTAPPPLDDRIWPVDAAATRLFVDRAAQTWTLPEQIAVTLAERIVTEQIVPGERIGEEKLAEEFRVSRGPVRDALKILEGVGLVAITSRKGAVATELSLDDLRELFELRGALLSLAICKFGSCAQPAHLAHYKSLLDAMRATLEDERMVFIWLDALDRLSLFLCHHCDNARVARQARMLSLQVIRYARRSVTGVAQRRRLQEAYEALYTTLEQGGDVEPLARQVQRFAVQWMDAAAGQLREQQPG